MSEQNNDNLVTKLKALRDAYGMTQDEVADVLGMNRTSLSKYENSAANPPLAVLRKLAKIYNVKIEYFVSDSIEPIVNLAENDSGFEPDPENPIVAVADLTHEERLVVMRLRLMSEDEREQVKNFIEHNVKK